MTVGFVYLIHFDRPYKHARHYLGWASILCRRIEQHRISRGGRLLQVLNANDIGWEVVWTWPGTDRRFERRLKRQGGLARRCPRCGVVPTTGKRPYKRLASGPLTLIPTRI